MLKFSRPIQNQRGTTLIIAIIIFTVALLSTGIIILRTAQTKHSASTSNPTLSTPRPAPKPSSNAPATSTQATPTAPTSTNPPPSATSNTPSVAPVASSGIKGHIYLGGGTGCSSSNPNTPCNPPRPQAGTVIIKAAGNIVATVKSDQDGYYLANVAPGTYEVNLETQSNGLSGSGGTVIVKPSLYTTADIYAS